MPRCGTVPIFLCGIKTQKHTAMTEDFHLGQLVRQELENQHRTVAWFAKSISCDRSNCYDIFSRRYIDTELLERISRALGRNFFKDLAEYMDSVVKNPTQV